MFSIERIESDNDQRVWEAVPGYFIKEIIKGCRYLEIVHLNNVIVDDETYDQINSLSHIKKVFISLTEPPRPKEERAIYMKDYFNSKL